MTGSGRHPGERPSARTASHGATENAAPSAKASRATQAGTFVAWLALAVSLGGLLFSYLQWRGANDQLALQRQAIAEQQGQLLIENAYVDLYDATTNTWRNSPDGKAFVGLRLPYSDFTSSGVFIVLNIYNISHSPLAIKRAGLITDESGGITPTKLYCTEPSAMGTTNTCDLPLTFQPQTNNILYLQVNDASEQLSCNVYANTEGLIGAVQLVDNRVVSRETQTFDPFSPVCAGPVTPPEGTAAGSRSPTPSATETASAPRVTPTPTG